MPSLSIKNLKKAYTTGDVIECDLHINPGMFVKEYDVVSINVNVIKREYTKETDINSLYVPDRYIADEFVVARSLEYLDYVLVGKHYEKINRKLKFIIPEGSINSSHYDGIREDLYNEVYYYIHAELSIFVRGKCKTITRILDFDLLPEPLDVYKSVVIPSGDILSPSGKKATMFIHRDPSFFLPGEEVELDLSLLCENGSISKVRIHLHHLEILNLSGNKNGVTYSSYVVYKKDWKKNIVEFKIPNHTPARIRTIGCVKKVYLQLDVFYKK